VGNKKKNNWNDKRCRLVEVEKDIQAAVISKNSKRWEKWDRRKEEMYPPAKERKRITIHTHMVSADKSGSPMFETEAQTSG
jgi:vacuolar-type H+-ATPase subunit C/Vma6